MMSSCISLETRYGNFEQGGSSWVRTNWNEQIKIGWKVHLILYSEEMKDSGEG